MQPPEARRQRRQLFVVVALSLFSAALLMLFLMVITGWSFFALFGVTAGFILLGAVHYLIWGREVPATRPVGPRPTLTELDQPRPGNGTATR